MRLTLNNKVIILIFVGVLVIILLNFYQSHVRNFFYLISSPVQKNLWISGQGTANFLQAIIHSKKIQEENAELRLLIQELLAKTANLSEVQEENKVLKEALKVGLEKEFKLILGQVTGKNISEDTLIINKGAKEGVNSNMPVITQQKILVGKIEEVYENFSRVQIISNKKSSFDGRILGRELQGLLKGGGNFKISFDLVPQYEEVKEGELITTTALGGIFPAGLLAGPVKSVKKSDIEPFQQIEIQPAFDITRLDYLFIIREF